MSISGSLFNAYSGLVAAARTADAVSNNVANALTDGYGRREIELSAASVAGRGAGVRVSNVIRVTDAVAIADRRLAQADLGSRSVTSHALEKLETVIGIPDEAGSLTDLVATFESTLLASQSRPDSQAMQQNILFAMTDLVSRVGQISEASQAIRMASDKSIAEHVNFLNDSLSNIAELNRDIRVQSGSGRNVNGLMDQRQILIDGISDLIPIKTFARDKGEIAILSTSGATMLDGLPAKFEFSAVGLITPEMTLASGALSGLRVNGTPIQTSGENSLISGGALAALFQARDETGPLGSEQIDAFARNLVERFDEPGVDATTATGAPGLFTDAGAAFDVLDEIGLAGRLAINTLVDPGSGGELWRLRDGLGATIVGEAGDRTLLTSFLDTLTAGQIAQSGRFSAGPLNLAELAGELTALNSTTKLAADRAQVFAQSRYQELHAIELESGVNTDQEMQKLMLVEQSFAANARVVSTIDEMLKTILGI